MLRALNIGRINPKFLCVIKQVLFILIRLAVKPCSLNSDSSAVAIQNCTIRLYDRCPLIEVPAFSQISRAEIIAHAGNLFLHSNSLPVSRLHGGRIFTVDRQTISRQIGSNHIISWHHLINDIKFFAIISDNCRFCFFSNITIRNFLQVICFYVQIAYFVIRRVFRHTYIPTLIITFGKCFSPLIRRLMASTCVLF